MMSRALSAYINQLQYRLQEAIIYQVSDDFMDITSTIKTLREAASRASSKKRLECSRKVFDIRSQMNPIDTNCFKQRYKSSWVIRRHSLKQHVSLPTVLRVDRNRRSKRSISPLLRSVELITGQDLCAHSVHSDQWSDSPSDLCCADCLRRSEEIFHYRRTLRSPSRTVGDTDGVLATTSGRSNSMRWICQSVWFVSSSSIIRDERDISCRRSNHPRYSTDRKSHCRSKSTGHRREHIEYNSTCQSCAAGDVSRDWKLWRFNFQHPTSTSIRHVETKYFSTVSRWTKDLNAFVLHRFSTDDRGSQAISSATWE